MKYININEGLTNNYLVHAVSGCLLSIPIILYLPFLGFPLLILSIAWFAATNGLEISSDTRKYRRYAGYLGLKLGKWKEFGTPQQAILVISSETNKMLGRVAKSFPYFMASSFYGEAGKTRVLTYDIIVYFENGEKKRIYDFMSYKNAHKALSAMETTLGIPVEDRVAEKIAQNRNRQRR